MSQERRRVLDLLAEGKITAEEAERLLEKLGQSHVGRSVFEAGRPGSESEDVSSDPPGSSTGTPSEGPEYRQTGKAGQVKYLRVVVDSSDGDKVNIRVPLALVRTGIKFHTMLPEEARQKLHSKGIDFSQLNGLQGEELMDALRELTVDVDSASGDVVRVFCE